MDLVLNTQAFWFTSKILSQKIQVSINRSKIVKYQDNYTCIYRKW